MRQVEREMRPLADEAEEYHRAMRQERLGALRRQRQPGQGMALKCRRARLGAGDLQDQILAAPDRDEYAGWITDSLGDPSHVAAAQPGALETRCGIVVRHSHRARLA